MPMTQSSEPTEYETVDTVTRRHVEMVRAAYPNKNLKELARILGVGKTTLYRWIHKWEEGRK